MEFTPQYVASTKTHRELLSGFLAMWTFSIEQMEWTERRGTKGQQDQAQFVASVASLISLDYWLFFFLSIPYSIYKN